MDLKSKIGDTESHRGFAEGRREVLSTQMEWVMEGEVIIPGEAEGFALVSAEPLSFWGGYDYKTGTIIDQRHPLAGQCAAGRVLAVPFTRGSSTTTAVLLEAVRAGTAPAAILTTGVESFFALASIVADVLYGEPVPLIALAGGDFGRLATGDRIRIEEGGARLVCEGVNGQLNSDL